MQNISAAKPGQSLSLPKNNLEFDVGKPVATLSFVSLKNVKITVHVNKLGL